MNFKFSIVVISAFVLGACQKEPEIVNVNKVIKCFSSKAENKKEVCGELNNAEQKVLDCVTSKNKANTECKGVSMTNMTFFMERERQPAKRRGTQFDFHQDRNTK